MLPHTYSYHSCEAVRFLSPGNRSMTQKAAFDQLLSQTKLWVLLEKNNIFVLLQTLVTLGEDISRCIGSVTQSSPWYITMQLDVITFFCLRRIFPDRFGVGCSQSQT